MLTQTDYQNLLVLLSRAQFNGIGEAAAAVVLHEKLAKLAAPQVAETVLGDGSDSN